MAASQKVLLPPCVRFSGDARCDRIIAAAFTLRNTVGEHQRLCLRRSRNEGRVKLLEKGSSGHRGRNQGRIPSGVESLQSQVVVTEEDTEDASSGSLEPQGRVDRTVAYIGYGGVLRNESVYRERFVVRFSEVGANGTTSLEMLTSLLQEAACNHVLEMDYGVFPGRSEKKLITVTTRMHIEVDRYPAWRDLLEVDTWFQTEGRNAVRRDWTVKDVKTGEIIAVATSKWVLMNVETKRLSKLTDDVREEIEPYVKDPPRWALSEDRVQASSSKIPKLDSNAEFCKSGLTPCSKDLDMNQHVNNIRYISWMLEGIGDTIKTKYEVSKITLEYRREALVGDVIESLASSERTIESSGQDTDDHCNSAQPLYLNYIHLLRTLNGDNEINRGRTVWRPLDKAC